MRYRTGLVTSPAPTNQMDQPFRGVSNSRGSHSILPVFAMPKYVKSSRAASKIQSWYLGQRSRMARVAATAAVRRRRFTRGPARQLPDASVVTLNAGRSPVINLKRTIHNGLTYGTNWVAGVVPAAAFIFDPSGLYGNTSSAGTGLAITDWAALSGIFDQYKVNSISVAFTYDGAPAAGAAGAYQPRSQLFRYNYDVNLITPAVLDMSQLSNVKQKNFTEDSNTYVYTFKPKVLTLEYGAPSTSASVTARSIADQDWTDMGYPAQLFGLQTCGAEGSAPGLPTGCTLLFSITYDISFKYSK